MNRFAVLLAADDRSEMFRNLGSGFRDKKEHFEPLLLAGWIALLVAVAIVLGLVIRALARRYETEAFNSPRALFRVLCRAHRLTRSERKLLGKLADEQQLEQPARLFLEPERFEAALRSVELAAYRRDLARLRARVFANATVEDVAGAGSRGRGAERRSPNPSQSTADAAPPPECEQGGTAADPSRAVPSRAAPLVTTVNWPASMDHPGSTPVA